MGCSLSFFSSNTTKLIDKRVLILGLDSSGKSCLLHQLKEQRFKDTSPTIGLNVESVILEHFQLSVWDVGGQATMLWRHYYEDTDAILFVVDLTCRERMDNVHKELDKLMEESALANCPIILIGNKIDIANHLEDKDVLAQLEFSKFEKIRKMKFTKISAKSGEGLKEFKAILHQCLEDTIPPVTQESKK